MSFALQAILGSGLISLGGLVGVITLSLNKSQLSRIVPVLVAIASGVMIASVFLHILPEAAHELPVEQALGGVLIAFIGFLILEKFLFWHHCHETEGHTHHFGTLNLIGDAIHNFGDGVIIAAAFLTDPALGWLTVAAVALHEIPQELSDFGVLLYAGFSKSKALLLNFLVATTALLGTLLGLWFLPLMTSLIPYILIAAAGGFLYIATTDLLPRLKQEYNRRASLIAILSFLFGIGLVWGQGLLGIDVHGDDDANHQEEYHDDEEAHLEEEGR